MATRLHGLARLRAPHDRGWTIHDAAVVVDVDVAADLEVVLALVRVLAPPGVAAEAAGLARVR